MYPFSHTMYRFFWQQLFEMAVHSMQGMMGLIGFFPIHLFYCIYFQQVTFHCLVSMYGSMRITSNTRTLDQTMLKPFIMSLIGPTLQIVISLLLISVDTHGSVITVL